jgi:DNA-directed RNA polymerase I subunit RPA2
MYCRVLYRQYVVPLFTKIKNRKICSIPKSPNLESCCSTIQLVDCWGWGSWVHSLKVEPMVGRREQQQQDPRPASSFSSTHLPPEETLQKIRSLTKPHVESFDFFLDEGLGLAVASIPRMEVDLVEQPQEGAGASAAQAEAEAGGTPRSICLKMWYEGASFGYPTKSKDDSISSTLTPRECRERGLSYSAPLQVDVCYQVDGGEVRRMQRRLGECPVMVLSRRCHLRGKKAKELVRMGEESLEVGGYFVVSGLERVIRLLQVPRRNVAQALQRSSFKKRGTMYSDRAVSMRCARPDQTTCTVHLHHLSTGGATLRFSLRKQEYLVPVVILLKALKEATDQQIYERLLAGDDSAALAAQVEVLLKDASTSGLRTQKDCLAKLGSLFRNNLSLGSHHSDVDAGRALIDRYVRVNFPMLHTRCLLPVFPK